MANPEVADASSRRPVVGERREPRCPQVFRQHGRRGVGDTHHIEIRIGAIATLRWWRPMMPPPTGRGDKRFVISNTTLLF